MSAAPSGPLAPSPLAPSPLAPSPLATPEPWDLVAVDYTAELLPTFQSFSEAALDLVGLQRGARVLDVAAGPGTMALLAAGRGAAVTALDFSETMLAQLRTRATAQSLAIEIRQGDGQALPFPDASFDRAFSMFGLMFFPDRAAGFRELHRVLRPGGRAAVSSWTPFTGAFAAVLESIRGHMPGLPFGKNKAPLGDADEFAEELRAAGFTEIAVHPVTRSFPSGPVAEFWASMQRTTAPIVLLRRKLGEAAWEDLARGVKADLERTFGTAPISDAATALVGVAARSEVRA